MSNLESENIEELKKQRPFFNQNKAKQPAQKYVAWIDLMGAGATLSVSHSKAAIFIGKLHDAVMRAKDSVGKEAGFYPFVDGVYITSESQRELLNVCKFVLKAMGILFVLEDKPEHRVMLRGAISFGEVIDGESIIAGSFKLENHPEYTNGVLLGAPLVRANKSEGFAPPFGMFIDETARQFARSGDKPIAQTMWRWWEYSSGLQYVDSDVAEIKAELAVKVQEHLHWCKENSFALLYPVDAINRHRDLAEQYFED